MTLSLDDVRNMRFRMARKSGYEVLEVDEFVDQVEEAFAQLIEENQNLKRQVEALKSAPGQAAPAAPAPSVQPAPRPAAQQAPAGEGPIVVTTSKEASAAVVRLVEMSTDQAERLVVEANEEAARIKEDANRAAHQMTTDARTRAERVESEARVSAERLQADALGRAEQLDRELEQRRGEMFGELENQRDQLTQAVAELRAFEGAYRNNLTNHLRSQLQAVESGNLEPAEVPALAQQAAGPAADRSSGSGPSNPNQQSNQHDEDDSPTLGGGSRNSDTPRLDALLGDH